MSGRITLAIAPSRSDRLYASYVRRSSSTGGSARTLNIYKSDDAGTSWIAINPGSYQASYGWYLCTSIVHPTLPDTFLAGGFSCRRTVDGGASWRTVTPPHVDLHAFDFDAQGRLLCGNDGGIHRTPNLGSSWRSINGDLGLIQFYAGISIHPNQPDAVYGGTQDNGTNLRTSAKGWRRILGGDGGYTSIDSTGTRVFVEYQGTGNLFRSVNGGSFRRSSSGISGRNCFLPPHQIFPRNPMLMIYGTERLFQSRDGGNRWSANSGDLAGGRGAISGLAFAPSRAQTIYVFTNTGRVQVTEDGGGSWRLSRTGLFAWPRTKHPFAVHPTVPRHAYLAVGAFGTTQLLHTTDAGRTWQGLDAALPDLPTHCVAIDRIDGDPPILYVGTDRGVHWSRDHGKSWQRYGGRSLPNAPVIDLRLDRKSNRLLAATQGRGLWQIVPGRKNDLQPRPTFRTHREP